MTYATYIDKLRRLVGDTKRRIHVDWTGDGSTTAFQMPEDTFPVYDDSDTYAVRVGGTLKTETTDYTLDKSTGTLTLVSTPTNGQAVTIDGYAVYLLQADWLMVINDVISSMGDDFWKEFVDTTLTTTANMLTLSLTSAQANCIAVNEFAHRLSSSDDWEPVESFANWRYDRENNTIYISHRDAFPTSGLALKVRGLKKYTQGDETTDDIDVQDRFMTVVEYGSIARYWKWRYKDVVEMVSKISTEQTRTPLQELIMLSDRFDRQFEIEKARLKPQKPAKVIPVYQPQYGRP